MGSRGLGCESWRVSVGVVFVLGTLCCAGLVKLELLVDVGVCWSDGVEDQVTVYSTGCCVWGDEGFSVGVVLGVGWGGCMGVGLRMGGVVGCFGIGAGWWKVSGVVGVWACCVDGGRV